MKVNFQLSFCWETWRILGTAVLFFIIFSFSQLTFSKIPDKSQSEYIGLFYFNELYGHLHQGASSHTSSLSTLSCGQPLKVYKLPGQSQENWELVEWGQQKGFVHKKFLNAKMPNCLQAKYPKFFNTISLDASEKYFWGRLYDQYIFSRPKATE